MSKIKNLYLPGTNKNIGYILGETMHIYQKYIKYFPVNTSKNWKGYGIAYGINAGKKFIVANDSDQFLELTCYTGWYHEIEEKLYTFFDCQFKTPDNLYVIEIVYLYKNWSNKKHER